MTAQTAGYRVADADHICTVCFCPSILHLSRCDVGEADGSEHWHHAPLCCAGCDCRSFEEAHPVADLSERCTSCGDVTEDWIWMRDATLCRDCADDEDDDAQYASEAQS